VNEASEIITQPVVPALAQMIQPKMAAAVGAAHTVGPVAQSRVATPAT